MAVDRYDPGTLDWVALHYGDAPAPRKPAPRRRTARRRPQLRDQRSGNLDMP